jgi:hypothetical protein
MKRQIILGVLVSGLMASAGFVAGRSGQEQVKRQAVEAEYVRVVSAIARTMRCSTVEEFERGEDHECDPSEIEQDAGLVDTITEDDPRWDCKTMGNKICGSK